MPKEPKKAPPKVEEKWVEWSDLQAGVHLEKAGHPVILFLGGKPGATTTAAPGGTTTAPPSSATTAAPSASTTAAPAEATTQAPAASTTQAPAASTTHAPAQSTTAAPASTTSQPPETTSAAPSTTTAPPSTTSAPPATTSAAPTTTTTAAPSTTTTAPPATTSAAPSTTTTAPPSTTTASASTTTTTAAPTTTSTAAPTTTTTAARTTTTTAAPTTTTTAAPTTTTSAAPTTTTTAAPTTTTTAGKTTRKTIFGAEHFETAKSFPLPLPSALDTFRKIAALANQETDRQLLILGHTDTQGTDSYNLTLSAERAASIQAYLINDNNSWYAFYSNSDPQKKWGIREDQYMLSALPYAGAAKFYARDVNGATNADYTAALKKFQASVGEPATGTANQSTRLKLILAYMQAEGTSVQASTTMQSQGCGMRNLKVKTAKNVANADNRRTEVYAFVGAITPDASAWEGDNAGTYKAWDDTVAGDFE